MRAPTAAAIDQGVIREDLSAWDVRCVICSAPYDLDFFDQARRSADEIPHAEFMSIAGEDHLAMDTASADPVLRAALPMLRGS